MTIVYQCSELLGKKQYSSFFESIPRVHSLLTEEERKELLQEVVSFYYKEEYAAQFRMAFDLIIGEELNLDFNLQDWAPSLLSQVLASAPYIELFDYFLEKGASLNFVADALFFYPEEEWETILQELPAGRYITCLDFADEVICHEAEHDFELPPAKREGSYIVPTIRTITIGEQEYLNLYQQAKSFHRLANLLKLRDHIIRLGGMRKAELEV